MNTAIDLTIESDDDHVDFNDVIFICDSLLGKRQRVEIDLTAPTMAEDGVEIIESAAASGGGSEVVEIAAHTAECESRVLDDNEEFAVISHVVGTVRIL